MGSQTVESENWLEFVTLVDLPDEASTEEIPNLLPRLNTVWLGRKSKTEFLARLDSLKVLWLRHGQADELPELPQLETLMIDGADGTVIDCDLLPARFPNLTALMIFTDVKNVDALVQFSRLRTLRLGSYGRKLSAVDLAPIGELATLKWLFIHCDEITDFSPLRRLANLESLELKSNDYLQQLHELREHLPDECAVIWNGRMVCESKPSME